MIILEILILAVIGFFGAKPIVKKKHWKDFCAYLVFFITGSTLILLYGAGIKIPYIIDMSDKFLKSLHLSFG